MKIRKIVWFQKYSFIKKIYQYIWHIYLTNSKISKKIRFSCKLESIIRKAIPNFWSLVYKLVHRQGTFNPFIFNVNPCSTPDIVSSIIDLQLCVSDCFLNFNFRARRLRPVERHVNLIVNPWIVSDACSLSSHVLLTRCIYVCLFYGEITTYYRR